MLNFGSKPSQDASLRKIAIWGANLLLCSAPKFGPHPGGSYGGRGGLSFYMGGKGRQWTQISHRKLKNSISHNVVILASEPDAMLNGLGLKCIFLFFPASLASLLENHTEIPYADIPHFPVSDSLKPNTFFFWKYISNVIHFRNLQYLDISPHFFSEH